MARNGSGTFSLTTSFVADTTISSSDMNTLLTDIGSEITNSIAKDGQSSMTAQLKIFSGTVSAPGLGFASETGTGLYRIGGSNVGISLSGTKYVDLSTTGVTFSTGSGIITSATGGNLYLDSTVGGQVDRLVFRDNGAPKWTLYKDASNVFYLYDDVATATVVSFTTGGAVALTGTLSVSGVLTASSTIELGNASDTTLSRSSAGVLAVEGNAVYMASGTDVAILDGGTGSSTASGARTNLGVGYAAKSDQITASSTTTVVAPGTQQYHPSAAKAYGRIAQSSPSVRSGSYGIASVVRNSTGNFTVTLSTAMADTNGTAQANAEQTSIGAFATIASTTTITVSVYNTTTGSASNTDFNITVFGTQ